MKLCTACRVRPATNLVGSWPVCGKCGGRSANDVLGISVSSPTIVGQGTVTSFLQFGIAGILLGLGLVVGVGLTEHFK
jgi:hypothetical protein